MDGFLLLDKPKGITSFFCVKILRKILNTKKIGFAGTLDPLATGLMVVAVNEATKLIPYLEGADKVYEVKIRLGKVSTTYDGEGEISDYAKSCKPPSRGKIKELVDDEFSGERLQVPPVYSAVWVDGKRAYDLARKNRDFTLKGRRVNFYDVKMKSYSWPVLVMKVHCSAGTYIRSFAHDLGEKLGCGGYVEELRRVKHGAYDVKQAVNIEDLNALNVRRYMLKPEEMFPDFPRMELTGNEYIILGNGGFIDNRLKFERDPVFAMYGGVCAGILEICGKKLKFKRRFLK